LLCVVGHGLVPTLGRVAAEGHFQVAGSRAAGRGRWTTGRVLAGTGTGTGTGSRRRVLRGQGGLRLGHGIGPEGMSPDG